MKIKFTKDFRKYKKGEAIEVSPEKGEYLISSEKVAEQFKSKPGPKANKAKKGKVENK